MKKQQKGKKRKTPESSILKLYYFECMQRGDPIRLLLHHAGLPFNDQVVKWSEWTKKLKKEVEYGVLPVLELNGKRYSQLRAILRYLGRQHGYYPVEDPEAAYEVDSIMDAASDVFAYGGAHIHKKYVENEENWKDCIPECYKLHKAFYDRMQKKLEAKDNKKCLVGNKLTIADFLVFSMMRSQVHSKVMDKHFKGIHKSSPLMKAYYEDKCKKWKEIIKKAGDYEF